ncbi:hypothetical protein FOL46_001470 [Perkinsus olseni]|uniref:Uncharacterized protein n=1 Tax=Perkinsus olseni TaxID=32597 RepID=A0A7J6MCQ6_PEROL|nr:hypothetical protein FOL46_001470 [Perkinsus olseni]
MGKKLMKELNEKLRERDEVEREACCSESFMDNVVHLDDKLDLNDEFIAEPLLESIAGEYDIHFNNAKRQYINVLPGDVSALGVVYTDCGQFIKFPDVQWVKFRDALTTVSSVSYSGALSLLGKLPDLVVTGAWNSLFKHKPVLSIYLVVIIYKDMNFDKKGLYMMRLRWSLQELKLI